jgi:FdhE protein
MMNRTAKDKCILRADDLLARATSSREVLTFYRHVLELQQRIDEELRSRSAPEPRQATPLREQLDAEVAAKWLPALFTVTKEKAPAKLAGEVSRIQDLYAQSERRLLQNYINGSDVDDVAATFVARVLVEPCARFLALQSTFSTTGSESTCPLCGGKPQLAVLRPEGDGGKRYLQCSFCLTEWEFRRVLCPTCAETDYTKLPRYSAEEPMAVRVEACDTCKSYLKSFDTTLDGLLIPEVDEIAFPALDIWASEQGYRKIQLNFMGF